MDNARKKQTLSLLDKLREEGKPVGRRADDGSDVSGDVSGDIGDERIGTGDNPGQDSDLLAPYSEEYIVEERKKRRARKQQAEAGIDQPVDINGKY